MAKKYIDKSVFIKRIVSLVNQINRKLKSFREAGYGEMYEHEMDKASVDINRKMDFTLPSGNFSKATKKLEQLDEKILINTIRNLEELNKHESLQTVKTYEKYVLEPVLQKSYETMCLRYGEENVLNTFGGRKPTNRELINYLESCHKESGNKQQDSGQKIINKVYEGDEEREKKEGEDKAFSQRETGIRILKERGVALR